MLFKLPQQLGFCFYDVPLAASPSRGLLSKSKKKKKKKSNYLFYFYYYFFGGRAESENLRLFHL